MFEILQSRNYNRFYVYLNNNPFWEFNHENITKKIKYWFWKIPSRIEKF